MNPPKTPLSNKASISAAIALATVLVPGHALADLPGAAPALAQAANLPRWPIYLAIIALVCVFCRSVINHRRHRRRKSKVFPKLSLRRRLFAPYSGGNCAKITFGSRHDA